MLSDAANTIESLSAKLADMEQTDRKLVLKNTYYVKRKRKDDVIVSIMYNRADNKYHFVNLLKTHICSCGFETIEEAIADMEQRKNNGSICDFYLIERSAEDCGGGWILCSTRNIPDMGSTVLIQLKSERDGITGDDDRTFDISYIRSRDNSEWFCSTGKYPLKAVKAWKPIKAYHEP